MNKYAGRTQRGAANRAAANVNVAFVLTFDSPSPSLPGVNCQLCRRPLF
uniref:Uncharacterized protein n=1 Tax=Physcomitrium patens TaxID=3218 RepID=A0A2K1J481_PHYPA|nr:hypothetical protein PHYPA_022190 [Physcomitrium patens]